MARQLVENLAAVRLGKMKTPIKAGEELAGDIRRELRVGAVQTECGAHRPCSFWS
ncbi:MAG: hypothetical protein AMXMBFR58_30570 [Phycisphaerae bacterium]